MKNADRKFVYGLHAISAVAMATKPGLLLFFFLAQIVIVEVLARTKPPALFLTGATLSCYVVAATFLQVIFTTEDPEGLWGLGYVLAWPGAILIGLLFAKRIKNKQHIALFSALTIGFVSTLVGFIINLELVCNTMMWCSLLSGLPLEVLMASAV